MLENEYQNKIESVQVKSGGQYKNRVNNTSLLLKQIKRYEKIKNTISNVLSKLPTYEQNLLLEEIISVEDLSSIDDILEKYSIGNSEKNFMSNALRAKLKYTKFFDDSESLSKEMRNLIAYTILQNVKKGWSLSNNKTEISHKDLGEMIVEIDLGKILDIQNSASSGKDGFVWVLSTFLFYFCEYKSFCSAIEQLIDIQNE